MLTSWLLNRLLFPIECRLPAFSRLIPYSKSWGSLRWPCKWRKIRFMNIWADWALTCRPCRWWPKIIGLLSRIDMHLISSRLYEGVPRCSDGLHVFLHLYSPWCLLEPRTRNGWIHATTFGLIPTFQFMSYFHNIVEDHVMIEAGHGHEPNVWCITADKWCHDGRDVTNVEGLMSRLSTRMRVAGVGRRNTIMERWNR